MFFYLANFGHLRGREKNKKPYLLKKKKNSCHPRNHGNIFFCRIIACTSEMCRLFCNNLYSILGGRRRYIHIVDFVDNLWLCQCVSACRVLEIELLGNGVRTGGISNTNFCNDIFLFSLSKLQVA